MTVKLHGAGVFIVLICVTMCSCAEPQSSAETTYYEHVRPLLAEYCTGCHQEGGVAPFVLTSYEDAQRRAGPLAAEVRARRMPPFLADNSGDCRTFRDSRWLSAEEIAVFEGWATEQAPMGDPTIPPPTDREIPQLTGQIERADIGIDYLPDQSTTDDYRCFVLDAPGAFAATGFDVQPGNPRITHHLIAYQAIDTAAAAEARQLDADADGPGYPCFGTGPQVDAMTVASWTPGAGATIFPQGSGVEIDGDLPLILEMHYNIAGGPGETDRTTLLFQTTEAGSVTRLFELGALDFDFVGSPGLASYSTTEDFPVLWSLSDFDLPDYDGRLLVHGVNGHMHERGLSMQIEVVGVADACLLDIPRWDFNWQLTYWFEEPVEISARDAFRITCEWTTEGLSEPLVWGEGTGDEMCLGGLFVTLLD